MIIGEIMNQAAIKSRTNNLRSPRPVTMALFLKCSDKYWSAWNISDMASGWRPASSVHYLTGSFIQKFGVLVLG